MKGDADARNVACCLRNASNTRKPTASFRDRRPARGDARLERRRGSRRYCRRRIRQRLLRLVNRTRDNHNLQLLKLDRALSKDAFDG
jgi:hypothetical protein